MSTIFASSNKINVIGYMGESGLQNQLTFNLPKFSNITGANLTGDCYIGGEYHQLTNSDFTWSAPQLTFDTDKILGTFSSYGRGYIQFIGIDGDNIIKSDVYPIVILTAIG